MTTMQRKPRRSETMSREEYRDFMRYVYSFPTKIDAAFAIGVSRPTLDGLIFRGSGKADTINKIREILNSKAA
jgi:hypothetical protein